MAFCVTTNRGIGTLHLYDLQRHKKFTMASNYTRMILRGAPENCSQPILNNQQKKKKIQNYLSISSSDNHTIDYSDKATIRKYHITHFSTPPYQIHKSPFIISVLDAHGCCVVTLDKNPLNDITGSGRKLSNDLLKVLRDN